MYLVLTNWILCQEELVTAADFEDVSISVLLYTLLLLLQRQPHGACPPPYRLRYHLLRGTGVVDLHGELLPALIH